MGALHWTEIAARDEGGRVVLPESAREAFAACLRGEGEHAWREGEGIRWVAPAGSHPMSPALALQEIIGQFGLGRITTAISYNLAWEADDTDGTPGGHPEKHPDFTATYQILGVRGRTKAFYFLDGGVAITPVLVEELDEPAERMSQHPEQAVQS